MPINTKIESLARLTTAAALLLAAVLAVAAQPPRVYLLDAARLADFKRRAAAKNPDATVRAAVAEIEKKARRALGVEILPVTAKTATPPSGDKRDYMSQAPYFWPDRTKPDGLPYVRRDGERNPEIAKYPDHARLDRMIDAVDALARGYYATGRDEYARRAAEILRLWFLDANTRMNPHLEYAQAIPGVNTGRGIGIIETRALPRVVDAIGLLEGSPALTAADRRGLQKWFADYLDWLQRSRHGRDEAAAKNNHGTFYDVQAASFALFVDRRDVAARLLEDAKTKRVARQIEPDGRQPLELERTKSWDYSVMNLDGLVSLAVLGERAGVDLWRFETKDGRGVRRALDYLAPFAAGARQWPFRQIGPLKPEAYANVLRRAARGYRDEPFRRTLAALAPAGADEAFFFD